MTAVETAQQQTATEWTTVRNALARCKSCNTIARPLSTEWTWRRTQGQRRSYTVLVGWQAREKAVKGWRTREGTATPVWQCHKCQTHVESRPAALPEPTDLDTNPRVAEDCDARCTGAFGPDCNCPCGGRNHGRDNSRG